MKKAHNEARRWFLQANDDLKFVNWIRKEGVFFDKGCFISQQAGEKILKACLYATGKRLVIGHSLMEMALDLEKKDNTFRDIRNQAKRLDRFYIPTRYPNGLPGGSPFLVYSADDLAEACKDLKKVVEISMRFLEKQGIT
jgi:HEPN domain-containing protein